MPRAWAVVLSLLLSSTSVFSDPVFKWIRLTPYVAFSGQKDFKNTCSEYNSCMDVLFKVQIEDGKIVETFLSESPDSYYPGEVPLEPNEANQTKYYTDRYNRLWLSQVALSEEHLKWIFNRSCNWYHPPPAKIKEIENVSALFTFPTDGLGYETLASRSDCKPFRGTYADGKDTPLVGYFRLVEKLYSK